MTDHYAETKSQRQARLRGEYVGRLANVHRYTVSRKAGKRFESITHLDWYADDHAADMRTVYRLAYVTANGKTVRSAVHWLECVRIANYDKARNMWTGERTESRKELDPADAEALTKIIMAETERMAGNPQHLYATASVHQKENT